jgi:hypothetical protein
LALRNGHKCSVKKDILFEARHTEARNKTDKQAVWRASLYLLAECCPVRQLNTALLLIFLLTFLIKQKSNKLLMGGKQ